MGGRVIEFARRVIKRWPAWRMLLRPVISLRRGYLNRQLAIENVTLGRLQATLAADPVVRVPEFGGAFAMDVRSDLFRRLLFSGKYEPQLAECCVRYLDPTKDAIDVGANIGFFSVMFGRRLDRGRRVLAIEPASSARERLIQNANLNGVSDRLLVFAGLAHCDSSMRDFYVAPGKEEYSSVARALPSHVGEGTVETYVVPSETVDHLVAVHDLVPGLIKMDVEGAEYDVLLGSMDVLAKCRPVIVSELAESLLQQNGSSARAVVELLQSMGYRVLDAFTGLPFDAASGDTSILCLHEDWRSREAGSTGE